MSKESVHEKVERACISYAKKRHPVSKEEIAEELQVDLDEAARYVRLGRITLAVDMRYARIPMYVIAKELGCLRFEVKGLLLTDMAKQYRTDKGLIYLEDGDRVEKAGEVRWYTTFDRASQCVERLLAGNGIAEIADYLRVATSTVKRDLQSHHAQRILGNKGYRLIEPSFEVAPLAGAA